MGIVEWCWTDYPEPQSQRSGWLEAAGWIPSIDPVPSAAPSYGGGCILPASLEKNTETFCVGPHLVVVQFLESRFTYAKASRFNNLGPIPAVEIPSGRQDVGRQMRLLAHQLEILKIFIGTGEAD